MAENNDKDNHDPKIDPNDLPDIHEKIDAPIPTNQSTRIINQQDIPFPQTTTLLSKEDLKPLHIDQPDPENIRQSIHTSPTTTDVNLKDLKEKSRAKTRSNGETTYTDPMKKSESLETLTLDSKHKVEDRTTVMFSISDIQQKLKQEMDNIPEMDKEDLEPNDLSSMINTMMPEKSDSARVKINRNFLRDAAPFRLEILIDDIKRAQNNLRTGFTSLDSSISIPQSAVTVISSRPKHGKTCFMLNLMINFLRLYPEKHFLYYTFSEHKREIELKLINMCGETYFTDLMGQKSNLARWEYELENTQDVKLLLNYSMQNPQYKGLSNFLDLSRRIHIIAENYSIDELTDSIRTFRNAFPLGAVFLDFFQKIKPEKSQTPLPRSIQLADLSHQLHSLASDFSLPIICGAQLARNQRTEPEYDNLSEEFLNQAGELDQSASLIIGLQNYSRSTFIGSANYDRFTSRFFKQPLSKPEKMPDYFKGKNAKTVLLVKIISNQEGPEYDYELCFDKWLMKISDLSNVNYQQILEKTSTPGW